MSYSCEGLSSIKQNKENSLANIYAIGHIFIVLNCQILNSCCRNLVTLTVTQKSQSGTNSLGRSTYELFYNTSILIYDRCIRLEHAVVGVQSTQWTSWPNARTSIDSYRKQQMGQQATSRRTTRTTLWSPRQGTETSRPRLITRGSYLFTTLTHRMSWTASGIRS